LKPPLRIPISVLAAHRLRQLMAHVEKLVIARGTYARWTVSPDNERAIGFYKSLGARYVLKGQCYWHLDKSGKTTTGT